jgi:hypothetical protein
MATVQVIDIVTKGYERHNGAIEACDTAQTTIHPASVLIENSLH